MIDYLLALIDDANDFTREVAKDSYAVLLCCIEKAKLNITHRTGRANAQRHVSPVSHLPITQV